MKELESPKFEVGDRIRIDGRVGVIVRIYRGTLDVEWEPTS